MEHKIGEVVTLPDGRKVEVVEVPLDINCQGCIFRFEEECFDKPICGWWKRADKKNVIYKEIK